MPPMEKINRKQTDLTDTSNTFLYLLRFMNKKLIMTAFIGTLALSLNAEQVELKYPQTPTTNQVDTFHGVEVQDPYRWMEDNNSETLKNWVREQNKLTFGYLDTIPEREKIKERLTRLWNYERCGIPSRQADRYFIYKNNGLQNQSVLYTMKSLDADMEELIDPNKLSEDGTVALSGISISEDARWLAYGLSASGSDWQEWRVRDIETGEDMPDHIRWVKFSGATWRKDGSGFYYCRYDEPDAANRYQSSNENQKIYFHKLGQSQEEDTLIYQRPDFAKLNFSVTVTDDDRYLLISAHSGTAPLEEVYYVDLASPEAKPVTLLPGFDADYRYIASEGTRFWFFTDFEAPRGKIISLDLNAPEKANWKTIIAQAPETLLGANTVNHRLAASYMKDACSQIKIFDMEGRFVREVTLPGIGTVGGFGGKKEYRETFYSFTSQTTPGEIFRYDMQSGQSTLFRKPTVDFQSSQYETRQVFYPSKDGTLIPMFITHRKGLELNGDNPTLLYGYGGFNISIRPGFSVTRAVWLEMGGVLAEANLRGGGEYGEEWHQQGIKLRKQNVFDDFIAAAEWLIARKYTSSQRLAIQGGSNGGLLVGACMTQRPELFAVAFPQVGVMDMLRYHLFTIGWAWHSDYGLADNEEEFRALYAYSPLHNLKKGTAYPSTMVTTGDHDDRVVPAHSFKFAAALQAAQASPKPTLIRIETSAGHGAGKPTTKIIQEAADTLSFMVREMNFKPTL